MHIKENGADGVKLTNRFVGWELNNEIAQIELHLRNSVAPPSECAYVCVCVCVQMGVHQLLLGALRHNINNNKIKIELYARAESAFFFSFVVPQAFQFCSAMQLCEMPTIYFARSVAFIYSPVITLAAAVKRA